MFTTSSFILTIQVVAKGQKWYKVKIKFINKIDKIFSVLYLKLNYEKRGQIVEEETIIKCFIQTKWSKISSVGLRQIAYGQVRKILDYDDKYQDLIDKALDKYNCTSNSTSAFESGNLC